MERHVDDVVELVRTSRRARAPDRVTFRTSSRAYTHAYRLDVEVARGGEWGSVDARFDRGASRVTLRGSRDAARVAVGAARLGARTRSPSSPRGQ